MLTTLALGSFYTANIDPMTGVGVLVFPDPAQDVYVTGRSVHAAAYDDAIAVLIAQGWELLLDDGDVWLEEEDLSALTGTLVIALRP